MIPVLTGEQMRAADRFTIGDVGLPGAVLMENAGAAVAALIEARWPRARPWILCGKGNNGGDGLVVARRLLGREPRVLLFGRQEDVGGDARLHLDAYLRSGGTLENCLAEADWDRVRSALTRADLIVDALLGAGLRAAPSGLPGRVIADLAALAWRPPIVAVDLPSGLASDSGAISWPTVRADVTVTFAAPKYGAVLPPACDAVGELHVADIGIPRAVCEMGVTLWLLEAGDAARAFTPRAPGAHKGSFGHVLLLAGSAGKTGAAALAAAAALRSGAGLVTVATPADALPSLVSQARPEVMTAALPGTGWSREALAPALELAATRQAVVLGPGIGTEPGAAEFVQGFVARCPVPLIIDAGGVTGLAAAGDGARALLRGRTAPTVLTPHPGEMGQLTRRSSAEVQARRLELAREVAGQSGACTVLKGQRTLVAQPDGRTAVNPTGNAGLATAGTGDVLAGLVGALLARGLPAWDAATAAVYLHGLAGDHAAARLGQDALVAGDLLDELPSALRALGAGARS